MLLGADTIRPLLNRLLPDIDVVARPRFSTLSYVGPKKATRLPPRTAVVGFSADEVYAIAELIRRQRGGTAIVMGALEPAHAQRPGRDVPVRRGRLPGRDRRDRHGPQHGRGPCRVRLACANSTAGSSRPLRDVEMAQIAGRAGRHMNDGTFGTTIDVGGLDEETVEAIENHRFDPLRDLQWRNTRARLPLGRRRCSPRSTRRRRTPRCSGCASRTTSSRCRRCRSIRSSCRGCMRPARVKLLWEVCQIPDFRKTMTEEHTALLGQLFQHLTRAASACPTTGSTVTSRDSSASTAISTR